MSRLDELIAELCPDGVEYKELQAILKIKNGRDYKCLKEGTIPVYGSGGIINYVNESTYDKPSVLIPRKGSIDKLYYVDIPFWNVDTIFYTEINTDVVLVRYVYYCLIREHLEQLNTAGGVPSLTQTALNKVRIPVPPLPVQKEIVRILDTFTELKAELKARKTQYEYYHNRLFDYSDDTPLMKLGDVCELFSGGDVPKEHWSKEKIDKYIYPIYSNGLDGDGLYGFTDVPRIKKPSVTIAGRGAGVGNAIIRKQPYFPIIRLISAVPKDMINVDYLYHCIKQIDFKIPKGGIPQLTVPMVSSYEIPVPTLSVQKKIADKLNSFEIIINDLTTGLPAEITAREKQYEHYRDQLLTFPECKS